MSYYKSDLRDVPLDVIDVGVFIAALYNNALTGGMGLFSYDNGQMTAAEGRHVFESLKRGWEEAYLEKYPPETASEMFNHWVGRAPKPYPYDGDGICIDYINGRSIKTWLNWDEKGAITMSFSRFWDYNHQPVAAILMQAKKGVVGKMAGQGYLDVANETRILLQASGSKADTIKDFDRAVEARIAANLEADEDGYIAERTDNKKHLSRAGAGGYQISFAGNGPLHGEVGHLVKPFRP